jgi:MacB-like protein
MRLRNRIRTWWKAVTRTRQLNSEIEDELAFHIDSHAEELMRKGVPGQEALRRARAEVGSVEAQKETCRAAWGTRFWDELRSDLRYAVRALFKYPGFAAVAIVSLALGIGANTAIFSLMDAVMLRSLPVKDPGQLVLLGNGRARGITDDFGRTNLFSYPFYRQMRQYNQVFSDVAAILTLNNDVHGTVSGRNETEPMHVQLVSGTYFSLLGVQAMIGRNGGPEWRDRYRALHAGQHRSRHRNRDEWRGRPDHFVAECRRLHDHRNLSG